MLTWEPACGTCCLCRCCCLLRPPLRPCITRTQLGAVNFDRQGIADHATQLAKTVQGNLKRSLEAIGVVRQRGGARGVCAGAGGPGHGKCVVMLQGQWQRGLGRKGMGTVAV